MHVIQELRYNLLQHLLCFPLGFIKKTPNEIGIKENYSLDDRFYLIDMIFLVIKNSNKENTFCNNGPDLFPHDILG